MPQHFSIRTKWTISRARDTAGYNVCTLYVNGEKVAACNGGGYDMVGTVLGKWVADKFPARLRKLTQKFGGLKFFPPKLTEAEISATIVPGTSETVAEREAQGMSCGLERYQAIHRTAEELPNATHTEPYIDGAYGQESVECILEAIGGKLKWFPFKGDNREGVVEMADELVEA